MFGELWIVSFSLPDFVHFRFEIFIFSKTLFVSQEAVFELEILSFFENIASNLIIGVGYFLWLVVQKKHWLEAVLCIIAVYIFKLLTYLSGKFAFGFLSFQEG